MNTSSLNEQASDFISQISKITILEFFCFGGGLIIGIWGWFLLPLPYAWSGLILIIILLNSFLFSQYHMLMKKNDENFSFFVYLKKLPTSILIIEKISSILALFCYFVMLYPLISNLIKGNF